MMYGSRNCPPALIIDYGVYIEDGRTYYQTRLISQIINPSVNSDRSSQTMDDGLNFSTQIIIVEKKKKMVSTTQIIIYRGSSVQHNLCGCQRLLSIQAGFSDDGRLHLMWLNRQSILINVSRFGRSVIGPANQLLLQAPTVLDMDQFDTDRQLHQSTDRYWSSIITCPF